MKKFNNLNSTEEQNKRKFTKRHWKKFVLGATLMSVLCGSLISNNSHKKDDENLIESQTMEMAEEHREETQIIRGDIQTIRGDIQTIRGDITTIRGDITILKAYMTSLNGNPNNLIENTNDLIQDINDLEADVVVSALNILKIMPSVERYLEDEIYTDYDEIGPMEKTKSYVPVYRDNQKHI